MKPPAFTVAAIAVACAAFTTATGAYAWNTSPQSTSSSAASSDSTSRASSSSSASAGSTASNGSQTLQTGPGGDTWVLPSFATSTSLSNAQCAHSSYTHWGIGWNFFYVHTGSADPVMECIEKLAQLAAVRAVPEPRRETLNYIYVLHDAISDAPVPTRAADPVVVVAPAPAASSPRKVVALRKGEPPCPKGQQLVEVKSRVCQP